MKIEVNDTLAGTRLDKLLVGQIGGLGRAAAKRLFDEGKVRVLSAGHTRAHKGAKGDVAGMGDVIEIEIEIAAAGAASAVPDPEAPLDVVLERDDLVIADKPAGQPT